MEEEITPSELSAEEQEALARFLYRDEVPEDERLRELGEWLLAFADAAEEAVIGRVERVWRRWPGAPAEGQPEDDGAGIGSLPRG